MKRKNLTPTKSSKKKGDNGKKSDANKRDEEMGQILETEEKECADFRKELCESKLIYERLLEERADVMEKVLKEESEERESGGRAVSKSGLIKMKDNICRYSHTDSFRLLM